MAFLNVLKLQFPPTGEFSPIPQPQLPPCSSPRYMGVSWTVSPPRPRPHAPYAPRRAAPGRGSPTRPHHPEARRAQVGRCVAPGCSCSRSNRPPVPDSCNCRRGPGGPPGFPPPAASAAPPSSHPPPPHTDRRGSGGSSARETQDWERRSGGDGGSNREERETLPASDRGGGSRNGGGARADGLRGRSPRRRPARRAHARSPPSASGSPKKIPTLGRAARPSPTSGVS